MDILKYRSYYTLRDRVPSNMRGELDFFKESTLFNDYLPLHVFNSFQEGSISNEELSIPFIAYYTVKNKRSIYNYNSSGRAYKKFIEGFFGRDCHDVFATTRLLHKNPLGNDSVFYSFLGTIFEYNLEGSTTETLLQLVFKKNFIQDVLLRASTSLINVTSEITNRNASKGYTLIVSKKLTEEVKYKNFYKKIKVEIIDKLSEKDVDILYTNRDVDSFTENESIDGALKGMNITSRKDFLEKDLLTLYDGENEE